MSNRHSTYADDAEKPVRSRQVVEGRIGCVASVVVPAHNEAAVIGRLLGVLSPHIQSGRLDVVVACNGCTDSTADIARQRGATVVEVELPSKIAALNAGDEAALVFPRLYIDADVTVTAAAIDELVRTLRSEPSVLCAAPPLRVELAGRPWAVRAYYAIWQRLGYVKDNHVGSGIYAVSERGRRRFGAFPDVIADDLFVRNVFARAERRTVPAEPFVIQAPRTLHALVKRRVRITMGNLQLSSHPGTGHLPGSRERSTLWWQRRVGESAAHSKWVGVRSR